MMISMIRNLESSRVPSVRRANAHAVLANFSEGDATLLQAVTAFDRATSRDELVAVASDKKTKDLELRLLRLAREQAVDALMPQVDPLDTRQATVFNLLEVLPVITGLDSIQASRERRYADSIETFEHTARIQELGWAQYSLSIENSRAGEVFGRLGEPSVMLVDEVDYRDGMRNARVGFSQGRFTDGNFQYLDIASSNPTTESARPGIYDLYNAPDQLIDDYLGFMAVATERAQAQTV